MGISYFNGKTWLNISREERLFCAYLYWAIKGREKEFVKWLNNNIQASKSDMPKFNPDCEWEAAYEACFYRDYTYFKDEKKIKSKRTFDLCLFSNDSVIIIEAKAQEGFKEKQITDFSHDKENISDLLKLSKEKVKIIALVSSKYNTKNSPVFKQENSVFDGIITWNQLAASNIFSNETQKLFCSADESYEKEKEYRKRGNIKK